MLRFDSWLTDTLLCRFWAAVSLEQVGIAKSEGKFPICYGVTVQVEPLQGRAHHR